MVFIYYEEFPSLKKGNGEILADKCNFHFYVTLSAKNNLILWENKAGFCRESHLFTFCIN